MTGSFDGSVLACVLLSCVQLPNSHFRTSPVITNHDNRITSRSRSAHYFLRRGQGEGLVRTPVNPLRGFHADISGLYYLVLFFGPILRIIPGLLTTTGLKVKKRC
jgi:hypothetical protein